MNDTTVKTICMVKRPHAAVIKAKAIQQAFDARYQTKPQRDTVVLAASNAEPMTPVMHPSHSNRRVGVNGCTTGQADGGMDDLSSGGFAGGERVLEESLGRTNGLLRTDGTDALLAGPLVIGHGDGLETRQALERVLEFLIGRLLEEVLETDLEHVHS